MSALSRQQIPTVIVPALIVLFAVAGCGKSVDEAASEAALRAATGQDARVERDGATTIISTANGEMKMSAGDDLALPDGFPDDVYLPAGYQVRSVMELDGAEVISVSAPGTIESGFDEASAAMQRHGWKQVMAMQRDSYRMLGFEKGERQARVMLVADNDAGVMLNLQLQPVPQ